ncbi:integration host factor subunit beta [Methylobacterium sp. WL69]|uniref:HU family DNA-binding protein n=1 Tax=Methylobacterium sp. WL69 TaxID=2603893 RepID=UPI0011C93474|nr:HU family DNA-binding protein [Methylobacterium sp. WL69]TXM76589.1 integration host factor subunit beta [Methylobacterium sp. WL69]
MIKSELILRVAEENPHLSEANIERIVNTILGRISDALIAGDRVELRGLGAFTVKERSPRIARNPRTGEAVKMGTRRLPVFKTGTVMQRRLNTSEVVTGVELDAEVERLLRTS